MCVIIYLLLKRRLLLLQFRTLKMWIRDKIWQAVWLLAVDIHICRRLCHKPFFHLYHSVLCPDSLSFYLFLPLYFYLNGDWALMRMVEIDEDKYMYVKTTILEWTSIQDHQRMQKMRRSNEFSFNNKYKNVILNILWFLVLI